MNNLFLFYLLQIYQQIILFLLSFNYLDFILAKEIVGKLANLKMTHKNQGLFSVCFFLSNINIFTLFKNLLLGNTSPISQSVLKADTTHSTDNNNRKKSVTFHLLLLVSVMWSSLMTPKVSCRDKVILFAHILMENFAVFHLNIYSECIHQDSCFQ